jgi:AcrR family transcriptional regulator
LYDAPVTRRGRTRATAARVRAPGARAAPQPRTRRDADERRAELLALGLEHFGSRAYDEVSIDAIARAAGISKGLLYHYFPTKRAFYAATIREASSRLLAETATAAGAPPLERLTAEIDAYLAYVRAHGRAYAALMRSGVGVDPEIARIVDETRATFSARLMEGVGIRRAKPTAPPPRPLATIALRGWIGFAEAASLAYVDAIEHGDAPDPVQIRDVLVSALMHLLTVAGVTQDP